MMKNAYKGRWKTVLLKIAIMCLNSSQILIISSLAIQFFSVTMTDKRLFWNIKKYINTLLRNPTSYYSMPEETDRQGKIVIILLIIGMVLQGFAMFV